jgi:hypothetical protein
MCRRFKSAPDHWPRAPGDAGRRTHRRPSRQAAKREGATAPERWALKVGLNSGAVAQLGERLHGMQEVVSSNLIGSIPRPVDSDCRRVVSLDGISTCSSTRKRAARMARVGCRASGS